MVISEKTLAEITEFDTIPIDRLKELARADKEGRVVILPFDIDQPIYTIREVHEKRKPVKYVIDKLQFDHFIIGGAGVPMISACNENNEWTELIDGSKPGEQYFLTREDAEMAFRKLGDK